MLLQLLFYLTFFLAGENITCKLRFEPRWHDMPLELEKKYPLHGDTFLVHTWRTYIQLKALKQGNRIVYTFPNNHHLLDAEAKNSLNIAPLIPKQLDYDSVIIAFGVDSGLQHAGVQGGDLDPEKGMYWSWQSGYIVTKLEVTGVEPKQVYEYHLGGFQHPWPCLITRSFKASPNSDNTISCDVKAWIEAAQQSGEQHIMKPGKLAHDLFASWTMNWKSQ